MHVPSRSVAVLLLEVLLARRLLVHRLEDERRPEELEEGEEKIADAEPRDEPERRRPARARAELILEELESRVEPLDLAVDDVVRLGDDGHLLLGERQRRALLASSMVLMQNTDHADDSKQSEHRKQLAKVVGDKRQGVFGGDPLAIQGIKLSDDKKSVFLEIENLKPVMQSRIRFNINAADKSVIKQEILHTINRVPAK